MKTQRFNGLSLHEDDRKALQAMQRGKAPEKPRRLLRGRILLLLDDGYTVRKTAEIVGGYPREISRVGKRYVAGGLVHALSDDPRPKPARLFDSVQEAAIVAMVCGPPPEGQARWSVRLLAEEVTRRGIAPEAGRETVRLVLARHQLKPWQKKNVVRAKDRSRIRNANGGRP